MRNLPDSLRAAAAAFLFLGAILVSAPHAAALDPQAPEGPVILTVAQAGGEVLVFDRARLQSIGWTTITTVTSFTEGPQEFSGVPLAALIAAVDATGTVIEATALNDYRVEIPFAHAADHDVFLALDQNGQPMRVRDRGPIWIVYPQDSLRPAHDRFDTFMVWQLRDIVFR